MIRVFHSLLSLPSVLVSTARHATDDNAWTFLTAELQKCKNQCLRNKPLYVCLCHGQCLDRVDPISMMQLKGSNI